MILGSAGRVTDGKERVEGRYRDGYNVKGRGVVHDADQEGDDEDDMEDREKTLEFGDGREVRYWGAGSAKNSLKQHIVPVDGVKYLNSIDKGRLMGNSNKIHGNQ